MPISSNPTSFRNRSDDEPYSPWQGDAALKPTPQSPEGEFPASGLNATCALKCPRLAVSPSLLCRLCAIFVGLGLTAKRSQPTIMSPISTPFVPARISKLRSQRPQ
jgi:hypothetical protein